MNIYTVLTMMLFVFIIFLLINHSIDSYKKYNDYERFYNLFDKHMDYLMDYFMLTNGLKDVLIANTRLNTKDYHILRKECRTYIWSQTPQFLQDNFKRYLTVEQVYDIINIKVDKRLSEIYIFAEEFPEFMSNEEVIGTTVQMNGEVNR